MHSKHQLKQNMEKRELKLDKNHKLKKLLKKEIRKSRTNKEHNGIENDSQINYIINIKTKLCDCSKRKKKLKKHKKNKKNKKEKVELPQIIEEEKYNKVKEEELPQDIPKNKNNEDRIQPGCCRSTCIASIKRKHNLKKYKHGNSARQLKQYSKTQKEKRVQKRKELSAVDNLQDYYEDINSDETFSGSDGDDIDKLICRTKEREKNGQLSKTNSSTDIVCRTQETCTKEGYVTKINSQNSPVIKKEYSEKDFNKTTCNKPITKKELIEQEAHIKTENIAEKNYTNKEYLNQEYILKMESFEEEDIKSPLSDLILIENDVDNINIISSPSSSSEYDPEDSLMDINETYDSCMNFSDSNSIHSVDTLIISNKHVSQIYSPTQAFEDMEADFNDSLS